MPAAAIVARGGHPGGKEKQVGALRSVFTRNRGLGQGTDWSSLADDAGARYGVPPDLILATIQTESSGRANAVNPADPSFGLMGVMLSTARWVTGNANLQADDLMDPATNVDAGTRYLRYQLDRYGGDVPSAVSAYNAGHATDSNASYVQQVLGLMGSIGTAAESVVESSFVGPAGVTAGQWVKSYWWIGAGLLALWLLRR
jgi:soluble lytic murein transglycosylase-like protein